MTGKQPKRYMARALAMLASLSLLLSAQASAAPWSFVPDAARTAKPPVPVMLVLAQSGLEGGEDPGAASPPNLLLNGALGQIIDGIITRARNASRNRKAVEAVTPLLPALDGFDANAVLEAGLQQTLANTGWLHLAGVSQASASNGADANLPAEVSGAAFYAVVSCTYLLSGQLDSVYAACENSLYQNDSDGGTGAAGKAGTGKLVHYRRTEVQVGLAHYAPEIADRKAQWLAGSAAPLKRALTMALTAVAQLSARSLAQGPADYDVYQRARKMNMGQYIDTHGGELIEGADNLLNAHESCFNRKNKSSVKVDSDGVVLQEENGSLYRCMGFSQ